MYHSDLDVKLETQTLRGQFWSFPQHGSAQAFGCPAGYLGTPGECFKHHGRDHPWTTGLVRPPEIRPQLRECHRAELALDLVVSDVGC